MNSVAIMYTVALRSSPYLYNVHTLYISVLCCLTGSVNTNVIDV